MIILIPIWLICGTLAYGLHFAYFQRGWPDLAEEEYWIDSLNALIAFALGIFGLIGEIIFLEFASSKGYQGFKWF